MKWLKRLGISLTIAFFAVCCAAVLVFNWGALGWKALSVPTGSMRPTVPPGSLVLMHRIPVSSVRVGDVITYTNPLNPKSSITHRVIKSYKIDGKIPAFITKGDANKVADAPVVGGQVLGKAVWHMPVVGHWLTWSKTWTGLIVLVYIPASLLMLEEVQRLSDYYRRSRPYLASRLVLLQRLQPKKSHRLVQATTISITLVAISAVLAFPAEALQHSNIVTLGPNSISVASTITPPPQCTTGGNSTTVTVTGTGTGNNNINVSNSNSQTGSSGNVTSTGNTTSGNTTSGSVTNTNCTSININLH